MATKYGSTTMFPKKKSTLTTYAKSSRKRQPTASLQSAAADDDSTPTQKVQATTAHRRVATAASPIPRSPSPDDEGLSRTKKKNAEGAQTQNGLKLDRKRKFSQVSSKAKQDKSTRSQQQSSLPAPTVSNNTSSSQPSSTQRTRRKSATSDDADIDMTEARLSSPPPTPTRSRMSKAVARATPKADMPFSPHTMQIWDNILSSDEDSPKDTKHQPRQIPVRLAPRSVPKSGPQEAPSRPAGASRQRGFKTGKPEPESTPQPKRPRRRLIDALVEQAGDNTDSPDTELSDDSVGLSQPRSSQISSVTTHETARASTASSPQPTVAQTKGKVFVRPALTPKTQTLRKYGQATKLLEEDDEDLLLQGFDLPESASHSLKGKRLELGGPKKWSSNSGLADEEDDLVSGSPSTKIRNIHELRQAGANTRVADEMQDLTEQIGAPAAKPSSSRRAGLLRIAQEIKNKDFVRQFRDHGIEATILKNVGRETDVVSACLILTTLITILSKWPSPHTIRLLQEEEIGLVFSRLLNSRSDMSKVVRDRKTNLSKRNQSAVLDVHNELRQQPIWGTAKPTTLSPRALTIKCLHVLATQEPRLCRTRTIFPESVTEGLLAILSEATENPDALDYPDNDAAIDLCSVLSILDFYTVDVANSGQGSGEWSDRLLPAVADLFGTFLGRPPQENKALETCILKLAINLTNNNLNAADVCISKGLVPALAGSACSNFGQVLASVSQDKWTDGLLDGLVLRLGILINFAEHSDRVRQVTYECSHGGVQPVDEFIRLFLENYRRTAEADSVEKSHLNVVFGYLAVLLGHLCLYAPVRQKFRSSHATKSMGPLLESIREFVHHHKTMESQIYEGDDGSHGQSGWTEIEALARQLEDEAAYD